MQRGPALRGCAGFQCGAQGRVGLRQVVQPVAKRLVVHHRAAGQQRNASPRADLVDQAQRGGAELGRRIRLRRVQDVQQVLRHAGLFFP
ncbi:hypothetical protein G6F31_021569 [Rhizopus arrhizus]|nr:hypothetical protein G6F31_021569 [Rhizopus arrhizus]